MKIAKIFIIDDDVDIVLLFEQILVLEGHEIIAKAFNGEEAIDIFKNFQEKPDIILMDHRMPIKTGIEASKEILEFDQSAKIIFTSADESVKEMALSIGVFSFISKPFEIRKFKENIDDALV